MVMARHDGGWHGSRDFSLNLQCGQIACVFNSRNHRQCSTPSSVSLDSQGKCKVFIDRNVKPAKKVGGKV